MNQTKAVGLRLPVQAAVNRTATGATFADSANVEASSLPAQCQRPGASQGFTNTNCWGVVQICNDCCTVFNPQDPVHPSTVCGSPYPCGACFGLPF